MNYTHKSDPPLPWSTLYNTWRGDSTSTKSLYPKSYQTASAITWGETKINQNPAHMVAGLWRSATNLADRLDMVIPKPITGLNGAGVESRFYRVHFYGSLIWGIRRDRQSDREHGTLAQFADYLDLATVLGDDPLANGQTEASPSICLGCKIRFKYS
jgi:hypothetical protein